MILLGEMWVTRTFSFSISSVEMFKLSSRSGNKSHPPEETCHGKTASLFVILPPRRANIVFSGWTSFGSERTCSLHRISRWKFTLHLPKRTDSVTQYNAARLSNNVEHCRWDPRGPWPRLNRMTLWVSIFWCCSWMSKTVVFHLKFTRWNRRITVLWSNVEFVLWFWLDYFDWGKKNRPNFHQFTVDLFPPSGSSFSCESNKKFWLWKHRETLSSRCPNWTIKYLPTGTIMQWGMIQCVKQI